MTKEPTICKRCGKRVRWTDGRALIDADTLMLHHCEPKVKIFTKEEIEKFSKERK